MFKWVVMSEASENDFRWPPTGPADLSSAVCNMGDACGATLGRCGDIDIRRDTSNDASGMESLGVWSQTRSTHNHTMMLQDCRHDDSTQTDGYHHGNPAHPTTVRELRVLEGTCSTLPLDFVVIVGVRVGTGAHGTRLSPRFRLREVTHGTRPDPVAFVPLSLIIHRHASDNRVRLRIRSRRRHASTLHCCNRWATASS
jgi:hypothetical protein